MTKKELFERFTRVRNSGEYNMATQINEAQAAAGVPESMNEEWDDIMWNYTKYESLYKEGKL